jgi:hypothetical protein
VRYFRAYWLRDDDVLWSPMKYHRASFPTAVHTATCRYGHPPATAHADCDCGLYFVTEEGWRRLCRGSRAPRVLAEVSPLGPTQGVSGRCPRFWRSHSLRAGSLQLVALWVPGADHCLSCRADDDQHDPTDDLLAALADRYQVPVARLGAA